jgi:ferredoxin-like protein FixX
MSTQQKNSIKALFLLVVFSMNTLAGFACSIGVDMGYNNHHHDQEHSHKHKHEVAHHNHTHPHVHLSPASSFKDIDKDDCCSNAVTKLNLSDKLIVHNIQLQASLFAITYLPAFTVIIENPVGINVNSLFQFVRRSCSLDDTDIRIAIQSFQI